MCQKMGSRVCFETAASLKVISGMLAQHCSQTTFNFGPNGMRVQCLDISQVGLLDLSLDKGFFAEYSCQNDSQLVVYTAYLSKALDMFASTAPLTLSFPTAPGSQFLPFWPLSGVPKWANVFR